MTARKKKEPKRIKAVLSQPVIRVVISKKLEWIEPYLRRAKKRMQKLILPARIRSYKPSLRKEMKSWGSCETKTRTITLATHKIIVMKGFKRSTKKLVALSDKEILMTLAHEMAHFMYEKHGYEQESYARTIFHAMGVLEICPLCQGRGEVPAEYKND
jgi:predicted metal-dependent hydrolase